MGFSRVNYNEHTHTHTHAPNYLHYFILTVFTSRGLRYEVGTSVHASCINIMRVEISSTVCVHYNNNNKRYVNGTDIFHRRTRGQWRSSSRTKGVFTSQTLPVHKDLCTWSAGVRVYTHRASVTNLSVDGADDHDDKTIKNTRLRVAT